MAKQPIPQEVIEPIAFKDALGERYLAYALSTITARSLPDVRDGLKPVHRRLLYAMLQLRLDPASGFKKCARVVGDVIGKYHPHGDVAVYDTMVRLAQSFAVRYPLVEGQGNFGSIDGDNPAAMRYTEARLTDVAMALLQDINQDTVDFRPTYDGEESEPLVLPSAFPNLLANGAEGIAVGMATSIPPHNVGEICDALLYLLKSPNAKTETLMKYIQGPDFPTGGLLVESQASMLNAYETGKGGFRLRARWNQEKLSHGLYQVVITEIPYQVQKSGLIEKIADLFRAKKLPLLGDIRDESAEEIRIVLEPKNRSVDPAMLMESLFKATDLEKRISLNMNVLTASGAPQVLPLRDVLQAFLDHRREVVRRRSEWRLAKIAHRLEVLEGFIVCFLNLDEVIRIIREEDEPKPVMMKAFDLTDVQVEAILNMRLRSLRRLEEMELKREHKELREEQKNLKLLLKSEEHMQAAISGDISNVKKFFGQKTGLGARRTELADAPLNTVIDIEAFIEKEPITVLFSRMGWLRALKGHNINPDEMKFKEGDESLLTLETYTTDKLLFFATNGRFYTLTGDKIPRGKGFGEPARLSFDLEEGHDIVNILIFSAGEKYLVAADNGKGFQVDSDSVVAQTRAGKQILNVPNSVRAHVCTLVAGDHVAVIGENRKLLIFPLDQLPLMQRGQGVALQKYKGSKLADAKVFAKAEGLSWDVGARQRLEADINPWLGHRGTAGRLPPTGFPRTNRFA